MPSTCHDDEGQGHLGWAILSANSKMGEVGDQNEANSDSNTNNRGIDDGLNSSNRDALAEGLIDLIRPALDEVDERVKAVR